MPYFGLRSYTDGCPTCADLAKAGTRGYMERYCPGCGKVRNRNVCPECGLTTLRTEATKAANRKTNCPDCGGSGQRHYDGQIGSEATPGEWLEALWACTAEWVRVLKPEGSLFVNLGDKYNSAASNQQGDVAAPSGLNRGKENRYTGRSRALRDVQPKSLLGLPWRYAIGCMDRLGLILRAEIVWAKPNGLPESVTDRVRRAHEQVFHFTVRPRYYAAVDEIREPTDDIGRKGKTMRAGPLIGNHGSSGHDGNGMRLAEVYNNPLGKLPGSVWEIPSQPLQVPPELGVDHFACVDADTEILTQRGWLRHDELTTADQVAGYDLDARTARWTTCSAVHRYQLDGELVAVEKRDISMRLTANHRTLVVRKGREQIIRADNVRPTDAIPRAAAWEPEGHREGIGAAVAALCGWIAAEGWYQPTGNVHLSQSATVNPDKVAAIDKLIASVPHIHRDAGDRGISLERGKYRARLRHNGHRVMDGTFATHDEAAAALTVERERLGIDGLRRTENVRTWQGREWVDVMWRLPRGLGDYIRHLMPGKTLTAELANLPLAEARALFDAFVDGDGHRRPEGLSAAGRISIYQKHRANLDWLQMIAVRLGYRTILTQEDDRFVLYCNEARRPLTLRGTGGVSAPIPRERYQGIVWCPTTGTGTMIARRNGRVFITGQSFPMELPRRIILGWSPPGVCTACHQGRRPVVDRDVPANGKRYAINGHGDTRSDGHARKFFDSHQDTQRTITGYTCACTPSVIHDGDRPAGRWAWREDRLEGWTPPPTRPAVVLDPFGGTGTTALVASVLGRHGITADLSADYCRLAAWRTTDPGERARAMQVPKPPPVPDGQSALFDLA